MKRIFGKKRKKVNENDELAVDGVAEQDGVSEDCGADVESCSEAGESPEVIGLRAELADAKDKYLRSLADLENFKKRTVKERSDLLKYEGANILADMLQVVDNLELALAHSDAEPDQLKEGLRLVHKLFVDTLSRWQVKGESAVGREFDPRVHSAISQIQSPGDKPGTVKSELRPAYYFKDKLLRPAEVVVVAEPVAEEGDSSEKE